jgi:hypothetical protein
LHGIEGLNLTVVHWESITQDLLGLVVPEVIISPLLSARFDILDLARLLNSLGYRGALRAYSAPLPNAKVIHSEVKAEFPNLDFAIFEVPPGPELEH